MFQSGRLEFMRLDIGTVASARVRFQQGNSGKWKAGLEDEGRGEERARSAVGRGRGRVERGRGRGR